MHQSGSFFNSTATNFSVYSSLILNNCYLLKRRPSSVVAGEAGCYIKGSGFKSRVKHGFQTVRP